jgi:nucleotide exchange factor SIL1
MTTASRTTIILTLTILVLTLISFQTQIQNVDAKEIEATYEWQIVEEGDTIPSGLHVKMDLETGTKWVKLLDEDDDREKYENRLSLHHNHLNKDKDKDDDDQGNNQNNVKITQLSNEEQNISPDIASKIQSQLLKQAQKEEQIRKQNMIESVAKLNDFNGDMSIDEKDYEMIYRTLMSLPEEDRAILNIPDHPLLPNDDVEENGKEKENKEKELKEFSEKLREIWSQRQSILKQLEQQYLANIPDIIRDRIIFTQKYVTSPIKHLKDVMNNRGSNNDNGDGSDGNKEDESTMSMDIIKTLEDLEYHLMDLDMTRDFHTMGGWPLLVSLLTDEIHGLEGAIKEIIHAQNWTETDYNNPNTIMKLPIEDQLYIHNLQEIIWNVQALASWCIGTAVKNIDEFHPWALEDLSHLLHHHDSTNDENLEKKDNNVNVISILLSKFATDKNMLIKKSSLTESLTSTWLKMKQKEMYALGALLRGNKDAALYFHSVDGPEILSIFFNDIIVSTSSSIWDNTAGVKLLLRIMMLGVDLIVELGSQNGNNELLSSLTDDAWCFMPMKLLMNSETTNVRRQALEGMVDMLPHCSFDQDSLVKMMKNNVDDTEINDLFSRVIGKIGEKQ